MFQTTVKDTNKIEYVAEVQTAGAKIYSIQAGNEHDLEVEFSVMKLYREKASALLKGGC